MEPASVVYGFNLFCGVLLAYCVVWVCSISRLVKPVQPVSVGNRPGRLDAPARRA